MLREELKLLKLKVMNLYHLSHKDFTGLEDLIQKEDLSGKEDNVNTSDGNTQSQQKKQNGKIDQKDTTELKENKELSRIRKENERLLAAREKGIEAVMEVLKQIRKEHHGNAGNC